MADKPARHGEEFQRQFIASIPRGIHYEKLNAQSPAAFALPIVSRHLEQAGPVPEEVVRALGRSRFSPKAPYDLQITAPCGYPAGEIQIADHLGRPASLPVLPLQVFALELKSTGENRLAFDRVDTHQEKGIATAGMTGQVAGVVVEFREVGEVWFVPAQSWLAFKAATTGKSLPLDVARRIGMAIERDSERGTSRLYWKVGDWMERCGAVVPASAKGVFR